MIFGSFNYAQNNEAYLLQKGTSSQAYIKQSHGNNLLAGPDLFSGQNVVEDGSGDSYSAGFQHSSIGENLLLVNQENASIQNKIELYQSATGKNIGDFQQLNGSHTLNLNEVAITGSNDSHIRQENGEGKINLQRFAYGDNQIPDAFNTKMDNPLNLPGIYQTGNNNNVCGAYPTGNLAQPALYDTDLPAVQNSLAGSNWLEVWQSGDNNVVGLVQSSLMKNQALINQENGNNTIAVVQNSVLGSNNLYVEQNGNSELYLYQNSISGNNNAFIIQH